MRNTRIEVRPSAGAEIEGVRIGEIFAPFAWAA
jgi:hypothetical protein